MAQWIIQQKWSDVLFVSFEVDVPTIYVFKVDIPTVCVLESRCSNYVLF